MGRADGVAERLVEQLKAIRDRRRERVSVPEAEGALGEIGALVNELLDAAASPRGTASAPVAEQASVLEYIIAHIPHTIFWKDFEGRFLGGNDNLVRDLGLGSIRDLVGLTDYDVGFPRDQADFFRKCDLDVMRSGRALLDIEEAQDQADGTHTLLTSKVPLRDEAGEVNGLLGIYVDITERKRIEEELRRARDEAESVSRAKSDFLAVASHELRTPLTLIVGPVEELLARRDLPVEARADLERIRRSTGRLLTLVGDILDAATLEAGRVELAWEMVDVAAVATQLVDEAQPAAARARVSLSLSIAPDLGAVPLDRRRFDKILLNLVGNALKFTPEGGRAEVALREAGAEWELGVSDTGPGIPREQQALLFQRFRQLAGSATRRHEGTGIGLALVKELAELMGGSVGLESEPGRGSRFWVRLPRAVTAAVASASSSPPPRPAPAALLASEPPAPTPAMTLATPAPLPAPAGRPRVLVADDNDEMRAWLVSLLSSDYEVEAVRDGACALAAVRAAPPAVIVSDVMMPVMDGLELLAAVKADPALRHIPVLLVTARGGRDEIVLGLDVGADDYLGKPFSPAELRARVRAACRLREAYQSLAARHAELADAHAELRATHEQLVHAAKIAAVGTLVAGLCHELNNPLSVILMHTQALLRATPAGQAATRKSLSTVEHHTRRCAQLVGGLLDFSRKKQPVRERFRIGPLFERLLVLTGHLARRGDVRLVLHAEVEAMDDVMACVQELETVLLNLIGNAVDATPPGGEVTLSSRAAERGGRRGLELAVRDTGHGIPDDVIAHIFDPFFTTKPVGQGTGLGLAISRKIVDDHHGIIDVETGAGGTTVRLWLPSQPMPPVLVSHRASPGGSPP